MKKKELKNLAKKIATLEKELEDGENIKEKQDEIIRLMSKCSFMDLMTLEEYISKFLTL